MDLIPCDADFLFFLELLGIDQLVYVRHSTTDLYIQDFLSLYLEEGFH